VLAQYAERRDELEEQCERDDLVSMLLVVDQPLHGPLKSFADASARFQRGGLIHSSPRSRKRNS
jgi:hypothetical protein